MAGLGEVAEELVVEEGTAEEGGMVAFERVLVAEVGVAARLVFAEGGEVGWRSCCRGEE